MSKIKSAMRFLKEDRGAFIAAIVQNFFRWLPDKPYLQLLYRFKMGHRLDLKNPKTFTEKLQWLKLYNRKPEYTLMVDKYAVKKYVADIIGEKYIIPTLGVWDKPEDIDWDALPNQFVLKTTHGGGGGGVVICKDKHTFNRTEAIAKLNQSMRSDIYNGLREWPYKNVPRRIIAETFMAPEKGQTDLIINGIIEHPLKGDEGLNDYKLFCFNGKVKFFKVDFGRFVEHHANYYSPEGMLLEFGEKDFKPVPDYPIELPVNLNAMIALAEKLATNIPFLRVDFYNINGKIYFGELTFYPASGLSHWTLEEWDKKLGCFLQLPSTL